MVTEVGSGDEDNGSRGERGEIFDFRNAQPRARRNASVSRFPVAICITLSA